MTKDEELKALIEDLRLNHEYCPKEVILQAADELERLQRGVGQEIEQEPVAMRMPKVGDEVVCIDDESLGMVTYLTAGGSPEIKFDDGSYGTYLLREFAELFRYATPPQRTWVGLTDEEMKKIWYAMQNIMGWYSFQEIARAIEAKLRSKNNG